MKKMNLKKFMAFVLLLPACGLMTHTQSGRDTGVQIAAGAPGTTAALNNEAIMAKAASLAVPFVRNSGMFNKEVRYSADLFSGRFYLTDRELVYSLAQRSQKNNARQDKGIAFKEYFVDEKGGRISFRPAGEDEGATKVSYFRGNDPSKWQSGLASYHLVSLGQVYPGIEVKLKASGKNVEKIFYVGPKTDMSGIKIGVAGIKELKLAGDGRLLLKNDLGELAMRAPIAWQEIEGQRCEVKVSYRLSGKKFYGFKISGDYDKNQPLVIDPELDTLLASTFLGGNGYAEGHSLALDSSGNVYLTGYTSSEDFPTTLGAYDRVINPEQPRDPYGSYFPNEVFISKLNGSLTELLASTYLGGSDEDWGSSLALDRLGNVFLTGETWSGDFPTTPGAYDRNRGEVFVSKLSGDLTRLVASTYLGGSGSDNGGHSLAVDAWGSVFIAGNTNSSDFPTTPGAYDRSYNRDDIFISKLNGDLTRLLASTFLGGKSGEWPYSLALDGSGNVYVAGDTHSMDFPTTPGAYDRSCSNEDAFVSKLDNDLSTLLASTFLGGSINDYAVSVAVDSSGNVYVTGNTQSTDFPTTFGAYDRVFSGSEKWDDDVFVSKLDGNLARLRASTFLGGSGDDSVRSLAVDAWGSVFVTGDTYSTDFPTTPGAYDRIHKIGEYYTHSDIFISKLSNNLTKLKASTFLGGTNSEICYFLVLDRANNAYVTGDTSSTDFPTTPDAFDETSMYSNAFVSKLNGNLYVPIALEVASPNGGESWVPGTVHDITWTSTGTIADVRIESSTDNGSTWNDVGFSPARYHKYSWSVPNSPSRQCLVRISDMDDETIRDTSDAVFSILMNIDLAAERREVRSFSIVRQYGRIQFLIGNASVPVTQYRILRRKNGEDFIVLRTITASELQNNQFQMQDKYLEKGATYTYRVDAYDAAGGLIGISPEKTI